MHTILVLLVGSQQTLTESLAEHLEAEPDLHVVGVTTSLPRAQSSAGWVDANVALLDSDLVRDAGAYLARTIRSAVSLPRIVLLADQGRDHDVVPLMLAGVSGWVDKSHGIEHLLAAIRAVAAGEDWVPPRLLSVIMNSYRQSSESHPPVRGGILALTSRERDVLACMVAGLSRPQIAADLVLSEHTVRTHAQNVLRKLGVHTSLAAVALARRAGLPPWERSCPGSASGTAVRHERSEPRPAGGDRFVPAT